MSKLFKAKMPEVGGYDLVAYSDTPAKATKLVKVAYLKFAKRYPMDARTWTEAKEYYCFRCEVVETDVVIFE